MKLSIKTKLIAITITLVVLTSLLVGIKSYMVAKNQLHIAGKEKLRSSVNLVIEMIEELDKEIKNNNISSNRAEEKVKEMLLGKKREDGTREINKNIDLGKNGYFIIYNSKGKEVAHPNLEGENVWNVKTDDGFYLVQDQIKKALNGGGFSKYKWPLPNNKDKIMEKITYSKYYPEWDWIVVAGSYMNEFEKGVMKIVNVIKWTLISTTLLAFLVVYILTNKMSKGIKNVVEYANKLAKGNLNIADLSIDHSDEIALLVDSINNMKDNLKNSYKKLKDSNDEIERQKEELQASYEQLEANNEEIRALNEELEEAIKESELLNENLQKVIEVTQDLGELRLKDKNEFLKKIFKTSYDLIEEADFGSVFIYKKNRVKFIDSIGHNTELLNEMAIDKSIFISENEKSKIRIVKNTRDNIVKLMSHDYDKTLINEAAKDIKESLTFNISIDDNIIGGISLDISKMNKKNFNNEAVYTLRSFRNLSESFFMMHNYYTLQKKFTSEIVLAVTKLLEIHDEYTNGHSQQVAEIATSIADEMELSQKEVDKCYWSGLVHDIGKIVVPEKILNKKGKLSEEEYEQIKKHSIWGYETLNKSEQLSEIAEYVKYHHERCDGKGYPEGLGCEDIPLISKILSVADAWDAMTSDRSYRKALSYQKAKEELINNTNTQFDAQVVKSFLKSLQVKK